MSAIDDDPDVAALRAFNRLYTQRLGLLNARLDGSPFTLTEARILYELAHRSDPTAAEIARALGIDRAQLSRTLKRFAGRGLIATAANASGGRSRPLALTPAGRATFAALERKTRVAVGALLDALPAGKRHSLLAATQTIGDALQDHAAASVVLRGLAPGDLGWIVHRQAVLYAQEYGWDRDYEALAARILAEFVGAFDPAREAAWIAEAEGRVVGSVFLVRGPTQETGKLRLLYVEPEMRGTGLGAKLVEACVARARAVGYARLELWTNSVLTAARRLYERAGFILVAEAPHRSFGKNLVGQTWVLDLTAIAET